MSELMIVMDRTASMVDYFKPIAKLVVRYIVDRRIEDLEAIGLVLFDDHYPEASRYFLMQDEKEVGPTLEVHPLTSNLEEFAYYLYSAKPGWGADDCEAISCAYWKAREIAPRADIWVVTDAIPHGLDQWVIGDFFSTGCPCGKPLLPKDTKILQPSSTLGALLDVWISNGYTNVVTLEDHFGDQAVKEAYAEATQETYEVVTL